MNCYTLLLLLLLVFKINSLSCSQALQVILLGENSNQNETDILNSLFNSWNYSYYNTSHQEIALDLRAMLLPCLENTIASTTQNSAYLKFYQYLTHQTSTQYTLNVTQITCPVDQVPYKLVCTDKTCIYDKVQRLRNLSTIQTDNFQTSPEINEIQYEAQEIQQNGQVVYSISIRYLDLVNDQIVSDPTNCINWQLYANEDDYIINHSRIFIDYNKQPTWPISTYSFDNKFQTGTITFNFTQQDLLKGKCKDISNKTQLAWDCHFELVFTIRNIPEATYFFNVRIVYLDVSSDTQTVQFSQISEIHTCDNNTVDENCQIIVTVSSILEFCMDSSCNITSPQPFGGLQLGQKYIMKQRITDTSFASQYVINNVSIVYSGAGFNLNLFGDGIKTIDQKPGVNIYQLTIPVVSKNVMIKINGQLQDITARRLLQQQKIISTSATKQFNTTENSFPTPNIKIHTHSSDSITIQLIKALMQMWLLILL